MHKISIRKIYCLKVRPRTDHSYLVSTIVVQHIFILKKLEKKVSKHISVVMGNWTPASVCLVSSVSLLFLS